MVAKDGTFVKGCPYSILRLVRLRESARRLAVQGLRRHGGDAVLEFFAG